MKKWERKVFEAAAARRGLVLAQKGVALVYEGNDLRVLCFERGKERANGKRVILHASATPERIIAVINILTA